MKKIVFTTIALSLLFSCNGEKLKQKIIISKSYYTFTNNKMSDNICRYFYKTHEYGNWIEFQDKCDLYKVGDTIK